MVVLENDAVRLICEPDVGARITSLVDRQGAMRVQYLGHRFEPDAMLQDLRSLARE